MATSILNLPFLHPLGYHEMLRLNMAAKVMLTDSGGLQEECCVLGTPCLTLRWNTERPITLRAHGGASVLVGNDVENLRREYQLVRGEERIPQHPPLWDGQAACRIVRKLATANASFLTPCSEDRPMRRDDPGTVDGDAATVRAA